VSQQQRADVSLRVTLTQQAGAVPSESPGLPDTGASVLSSALLLTGSVLLLTGAAVLGVRPRLRRARGER